MKITPLLSCLAFLFALIIPPAFGDAKAISLAGHRVSAAEGDEPLAEKVVHVFSGKTFRQLYSQFEDLQVPALPADAQRTVAAVCSSKTVPVTDRRFVAQVRLHILPVLRLYNLERINLLIFQDEMPVASTVPGSVLMLSTGLIKVSSSIDELRAVVAHELAHDLLFSLAGEARIRENFSSLRQIEMMCDGFSVAAIAELRGDVGSVQSIMRKVLIDHEGQGELSTHPLLETRLRVVAALADALAEKPGE